MMLRLFDQNKQPVTDLSGYVDGGSGGVYVFKFLLHNDDPTLYYTDLRVEVDGVPEIIDPDELGITVRISSPGEDEFTTVPTEKQWLSKAPHTTLALADVGDSGAANLGWRPVFIRFFVPGLTTPRIFQNIELNLYGVENNVSV